MRPSERRVAALLLLGAGVGWLGYKAHYLWMPLDAGTGILLISPGLALFTASTFVAFPGVRRRLGGVCLAVGLIAGVWLTLDPRTHTVYHEYSGLVQVYGKGSLFASPDPIRSGLVLICVPSGVAFLFGRFKEKS